MTDLRWTGSRVPLAVRPGARAVVAVHDPGLPQAERDQWLGAAQHAWDSWVYAQRGHAPSGWAAGQLYRISDFAIDLIRLLRDVVGEPAVLAGAGAGGLAAVLAAAAVPDLVAGLHLLPGSGWGTDPARLVGEDGAPNSQWLTAVSSAGAPPAPDGDDPVLAAGPAEPMHWPALRAAAARVQAPWSVQGQHFLQSCLPASRQAATPLLATAGRGRAPVAGTGGPW
jgi:pimeloyl-ACP methyl ester carboxylesterase